MIVCICTGDRGQRMKSQASPHPSFRNVYLGALPVPLEAGPVLEFWEAYERAVNDGAITQIENLERTLANLDCYVEVNGMRFHAAGVDLQIYPSTGGYSLRLDTSTARGVLLL